MLLLDGQFWYWFDGNGKMLTGAWIVNGMELIRLPQQIILNRVRFDPID